MAKQLSIKIRCLVSPGAPTAQSPSLPCGDGDHGTGPGQWDVETSCAFLPAWPCKSS